jgi:hypothetical protein
MEDNIHNENGSFICPECGHNESREIIFHESKPRNQDPWSNVFQIMTCGKCQSQIPAHLGERWDGLSMEDAKKEWKKVYRGKGKV